MCLIFCMYIFVTHCYCMCVTADTTTFTVPLIPEMSSESDEFDGINDPALLHLLEGGKDVVRRSISSTSDVIRRTLALSADKKAAQQLYKQERKESLQKILAIRKTSTAGTKRQLFKRVYPVHEKQLPKATVKKKTKKEKDEEGLLANCGKRNKNIVRDRFRVWAKDLKNVILRELLAHVDTPKEPKDFKRWIKDEELITHNVIDAAYPSPNELGAAMKRLVPEKGAVRVQNLIKDVCVAGPCLKCEAMILITGRVCHGMYGKQVIPNPPVFGKSREDATKPSLVCVSFCASKEDQSLKIDAAARRRSRRMPQITPGSS